MTLLSITLYCFFVSQPINEHLGFFLMDFTFLIAIYCFHPLLASGANI